MARVYVGNLPVDIRERELEDLFYKYGRIRDIDIKRPMRPPAFAFVAFDDYRDAEDAVYGRDGYQFDGQRLRCEMAKDGRGRDGGRDGAGGRGGRDEDRVRGKAGGGRRAEWGVVVSGLPKSCSWQDLKDFMRKAGDVVYTDVNGDAGEGVVEFSNREDMEEAVRKLDDTEFKNRYDAAFIRIKMRSGAAGPGPEEREERDDRGRDRSRSRSRSRSRDRKDDDDRRDDRDGGDDDKRKAAHDDADKQTATGDDDN